jgi:hypothetical protein
MNQHKLRITGASGINPVEAGFGLVHDDTIVCTTNDRLIATPGKARVELTVGGRTTSGDVATLGLGPGQYDAELVVGEGAVPEVRRPVTLILVPPERVCRRFGARYGTLEYTLPAITARGRAVPWDSLWRTGECPDIVVDFEAPYKFVLWRGMSFAPSWALANRMTSLFFAETVEPGVFRDCCEMMSDRECRYTHARVVHNSAARVVIHWRCALADSAYTICRNQWVDEMFYVYPDGVAVRNVTLHLDPKDEAAWQTCPRTGGRIPCNMIQHPPGKRTFNDMEFITVNPPGATSDEVTPQGALTLLDSDRFAKTFQWPKPESLAGDKLPALRDYIFRMNYSGRQAVFVASPGNGLQVALQPNNGMRFDAAALVQDDQWTLVENLPSSFADHIHWPVTRGYGTTPLADRAQFLDRPTHTFLGFANHAPLEVRENGDVTWSWFSGIAPNDDAILRARVKSWTCPATITGASYVPRQAAYTVAEWDGKTLTVAAAHPVVRPTFLLEDTTGDDVTVLSNGKRLDRREIAVGSEHTLRGSQVVVTLRQDLAPGSTIEFRKGPHRPCLIPPTPSLSYGSESAGRGGTVAVLPRGRSSNDQ